MRGAWLLQAGADRLGGECSSVGCKADGAQLALLLAGLSASILAIMCAMAFFREDKDEQITPLCPQMIVREPELVFSMNLGEGLETTEVRDADGNVRCKVVVDWPDPFRPGSGSGVAATVRLQSESGELLSTVVARNVAMQGQGLALCRAGCEIFGFVESEYSPKRYNVRHRTGVLMLTLLGDFGSSDLDVAVLNPAGMQVCSVRRQGSDGPCTGRVMQHIDAGLVLSTLLATHLHQRLVAAATTAAAVLPVLEGALPVGGARSQDSDPVEQPEEEAPPDGDGSDGSSSGGGVAATAAALPTEPSGSTAPSPPVFRGASADDQASPAPMNSPRTSNADSQDTQGAQEPDVSAFVGVGPSHWLPGRVAKRSKYGVFIDVTAPAGGSVARGFAHITEVLDPRSGSDGGPGAAVGEEVRVRVLKVEASGVRSSLRLSMLEPPDRA